MYNFTTIINNDPIFEITERGGLKSVEFYVELV